MDNEYCNECGGTCDGVHAIHNYNENDEIDNIVMMLVSRGNKVMLKVYEQLKERIENKINH